MGWGAPGKRVRDEQHGGYQGLSGALWGTWPQPEVEQGAPRLAHAEVSEGWRAWAQWGSRQREGLEGGRGGGARVSSGG